MFDEIDFNLYVILTKRLSAFYRSIDALKTQQASSVSTNDACWVGEKRFLLK